MARMKEGIALAGVSLLIPGLVACGAKDGPSTGAKAVGAGKDTVKVIVTEAGDGVQNGVKTVKKAIDEVVQPDGSSGKTKAYLLNIDRLGEHTVPLQKGQNTEVDLYNGGSADDGTGDIMSSAKVRADVEPYDAASIPKDFFTPFQGTAPTGTLDPVQDIEPNTPVGNIGKTKIVIERVGPNSMTFLLSKTN